MRQNKSLTYEYKSKGVFIIFKQINTLDSKGRGHLR